MGFDHEDYIYHSTALPTGACVTTQDVNTMDTCDTTSLSSLPGWGEDFDEAVAAAGRVAMQTGSVTPLVKEELKCAIQSRRIAQGKQELSVSFDTDRHYELTPEEEEKVAKRKNQNKKAARRFRQRQKETSHDYVKRIQKLESSNTSLKFELTKLKREKTLLEQKLHKHLQTCPQVISC